MWALFGRDFGYDLGEELPTDKDFSFWRVYKGKKKGTNENVSVFYWSISTPGTNAHVELANSAVKRLKTLRHPCLLTYLHSYQGYQSMYLATESVVPVSYALSKNKYTPSQKTYAISYGLHQILSALNFLHTDCGLSHNNVNRFSIFVNKAGEWKLFGLEFSTAGNEQPPAKDVLMQPVYLYDPPEADHPSRERNKWSYDTWGFGCLIWEIYNGSMANIPAKKRQNGKIPKALLPIYQQCYVNNAMERPSPGKMLEQLTRPNQFLNNKFIDTMLYLREIHIKDNEDKINFFNSLPNFLDSFPQDACLYRILPELINAFEFGNAGASVLPSIFKLGKKLKEDEYQEMVVPCIVKMFLSKDRSMRIKLLEKMGEFIDNFSPIIVNTQIYPNVAQGFLDTSPTIREHTIKCMLPLAPKLNSQNLNDDLLKHFARLQTKDEQGGIRTNTTVCLGRIASYLQPETRQKILMNAFIRALRDPFAPARTAAVLAFSATEHYYTIKDIASKVLPALCYVTIDPDKGVRDQAFKSITGFLNKLCQLSEEPNLLQEFEKDLQSTSPSAVSSSWTSWAVSSLVDKLTSSKSSSTVAKSTSPVREETKLIVPKVEVEKASSTEPKVELKKASSTEPKVELKKASYTEPKVEYKDYYLEVEEVSKAKTKPPPSPIHYGEDVVPYTVSQMSKIDAQITIHYMRDSLLDIDPDDDYYKWDMDEGWDDFGDIDLKQVEDNRQVQSQVPITDGDLPFVKETKKELMPKASLNADTSDGWDNEDEDWGNWDDAEFSTTTSSKKTQPAKKQTNRKKD